MNRTYVVLAVAGITMLAACSGSDGQVRVSGPDPVTVPSVTDAPDSTDPAPEPTEPATTDAVATTNAPSPTSTTIEPTPTTTLDPIAEIEAAVKQARLDGRAAFAVGEADPTDLTLRTPFAEFMTGDRLRLANEDLDALAQGGLALRPGISDISRIVFEGSVELPDGPESNTAFLTECQVNSDVLYVAPTASQVEAIVDDGIFTFRTRVEFVLEDGSWKHSAGIRLERVAGLDAC